VLLEEDPVPLLLRGTTEVVGRAQGSGSLEEILKLAAAAARNGGLDDVLEVAADVAWGELGQLLEVDVIRQAKIAG